MNLTSLKTLPPGVEAAAELIADLDQCFLLGFARLGPTQHEALDGLAATFSGSPLHQPLSGALDAIKRSEFLSKHFVAIAAARAALQGAQYDALLRQASEALGRKAPAENPAPAATSPEGAHTALFSSAQQWLMELALAGFKHLSMETLAPFMATLEQMQSDPKLSRVAALLTGFLNELLMASSSAGEDVPVFRWGDLWSRAMIMAQQPPVAETGAPVTGTFFPLGVDVRTHPHFVNILVYGLLESAGDRRVARISLSSYKVDVISQNEVWHLFRPLAEPIMESLAATKSLELSNMPLLSSGDLLWTGKAKIGAAFDPLEKAKFARDAVPLTPASPLSRHPVQLSELVCLENCSVQKAEIVFAGAALPLASSELTEESLAGASAVTGLLRFDSGRWSFQPLCAKAKAGKKEVVAMSGSGALAFCKKDKSKTLATLSERASKLLRA